MLPVVSFRTRRMAIGAAVAAVVVSTLASTSVAHAAVPLLSSTIGPHCTSTPNTPVAGQTTLTDSTYPTLTSVTVAKAVTAKPKATLRIVAKVSDNCSGSRALAFELHNATTGKTGVFEASYVTSSITSSAIVDTWRLDLPLYGSDAGSITLVHVAVVTGFTSLIYTTKANPTVDDVIDFLPHDDQITPASYHNLSPAHSTKVVVRAATTLKTDATPEPAKHGHAITVKATLQKLKTSTYAAYGSQYVTLQYRAPGGSWHALKKVKTSSAGVAKATYTPRSKGSYSFRAVYSGSTYVVPVTSSIDSVKVS